MFYACVRVKKTGQIIKKKFEDREEAREYLSQVRSAPDAFDIYDQFWTE